MTQVALTKKLKIIVESLQTLLEDLEKNINVEEDGDKLTPPSGGKFAWRFYIREYLAKSNLKSTSEIADFVARRNGLKQTPDMFIRRVSQELSNMFYVGEIGRHNDADRYKYGKRELFSKDHDGRLSKLLPDKHYVSKQ